MFAQYRCLARLLARCVDVAHTWSVLVEMHVRYGRAGFSELLVCERVAPGVAGFISAGLVSKELGLVDRAFLGGRDPVH